MDDQPDGDEYSPETLAELAGWRPSTETREAISRLAGAGIVVEELAEAYRNPITRKALSVEAFREVFRHALATSRVFLVDDAVQALSSVMKDGKNEIAKVKAAEIVLKTRGGWAETKVPQTVRLTGENGGAVKVEHEAGGLISQVGAILQKIADLRRAEFEQPNMDDMKVVNGEAVDLSMSKFEPTSRKKLVRGET